MSNPNDPQVKQKLVDEAFEKLEKAQSILAAARLWTFYEVESEASRADTQIADALANLRILLDDEFEDADGGFWIDEEDKKQG